MDRADNESKGRVVTLNGNTGCLVGVDVWARLNSSMVHGDALVSHEWSFWSRYFLLFLLAFFLSRRIHRRRRTCKPSRTYMTVRYEDRDD